MLDGCSRVADSGIGQGDMLGGFRRSLVIAVVLGVCAPIFPSSVLAKEPPFGRPAPQQYASRIGPGRAIQWSRLPKRSPGDHAPVHRPLLRPVAAAADTASQTDRATTNVVLPREVKGAVARTTFGQTPELLTQIDGVTRSQLIQGWGLDQASEPPDTQMAASADRLVEMVNSTMTVWTKAGSLLGAQDLNVFFGVLAGYSFGDPKVLYDPPSGRWFASGFSSNISNASEVYVAVSASSDPMAKWIIYSMAFSSDLNDQPKIGIKSDKLVLSWNEYSSTKAFVGQRTQVLQKTDLLAGGNLNFVAYVADNTRFNLVPVAGSPSATAYLVYNGNSMRGTTYAGGYVGMVAISGTPLDRNVIWTESDPLIGATSIPPRARQPQAAPDLDTGDDRFLSAAQTGSIISVMGNDGCVPIGDSVTRSCLKLLQLSISGSTTVVSNVRYGSAGTDLFYPAVATDSIGNLFSVFSASSSGLYPSAFAGVQPVGASASLILVSLHAGSGSYNYTPCGYSNRWGDYSAAALDPLDPSDVWLAGEYSAAATDSCNWGTAFGRLTLAAPTVTSVSPMSGPAPGGTVVTLTGSDFVQGATSVMFGAVNSTSVSVESPNVLTAVAPPEPAGTVQVTAATADGSSAPLATDRFTFIERATGSVGQTTKLPRGEKAPPAVARPRPSSAPTVARQQALPR